MFRHRWVNYALGVLVVAALTGLGWWMQESATQHAEARERLDALEDLTELGFITGSDHSFVVLARNIVRGEGLCLTYATAFGAEQECHSLWTPEAIACYRAAQLGEAIPDCWRPAVIGDPE